MFHHIFPAPQVKRWEIISFNDDMHEFPNELPNDSRVRNLGNQEIVGKCLIFIERLPGTQSPRQNKNFISTNKKVPKNSDQIFSQGVLLHIGTSVSLRYFVTACLWKSFFDSKSSWKPPTLFSFRIFCNFKDSDTD